MLKKNNEHGIKTYLLVFLLLQLVLVAFLFSELQHKNTKLYRELITETESSLKTTLYTYNRLADMIFQELLNRPEITDIVSKAYAGDETKRTKLRNKLYKKLLPTYQRLRNHGFRQFHFHFPDGVSFLRLHRPGRFGDPLFPFRPSVRIANIDKIFVEGFEEGRNFHAFRYVFPLLQNNIHVGSVEVSVPFYSVQKTLINAHPSEYFFMLKKKNADRVLFPDQHNNYLASRLSDDYLVEKEDLKNPTDHRFHIDNKSLREIANNLKPSHEFAALLATQEPFVTPCASETNRYLAVFIPVYNVDRTVAGYFFTYTSEFANAAIEKSYFITYILVTLLTILLLATHKYFTARARESLHFQRALLDSIPTPVFLKDSLGKYVECNAAHAELLGAEPKHIIGKNLQDACLNEQNFQQKNRESELLTQGAIHKYETSKSVSDQDDQYLQIIKTPLTDRNNNIVGIVGTILDVSPLKKYEGENEGLRRRLSLVLDSVNDAIFVLDRAGEITLCNHAAETMLGLYGSEILGTTFDDLVEMEEPESAISILIPACKQRVSRTTAMIRLKDRSSLPVEFTINPIVDTDKIATGVVITIRDITTHKNTEVSLRDREAQFYTIFNAISDGLLVLDQDGNIIDANERAVDLYGYGKEELCQIPGHYLFLPQFQEPFTKLIREPAESANFQEEMVSLRKNSSIFPVKIKCFSFHINTIPHILVIIRDLTERNKSNTELQKAKKESEAASRAKNAFLANMSHEIRTPMNAIIGMNRLSMSTKLTIEQYHYLKTSQDAATGLLRLLNDILDLSKIEAGQIYLMSLPFDLRSTMEDAIKSLSARAHEKGVEIFSSLPDITPTSFIGDQVRVKQIITNLLGNAVKFTESGSVLLKCKEIKEQSDQDTATLHFSVTDTGIGIPEQKQQCIFDDFTQAENSITQAKGGSGLGLAISKKLCKMMDGDIWVESSPGKGSTFHFTLKLLRDAVSSQTPFNLPNGFNPTRHPVLVATQNSQYCQELMKIIRGWDLSCNMAGSGRELSDELNWAADKNKPFGLFIIEQRIGNLGISELMEIIRKDPVYENTPVIILHTAVTPTPCKWCDNYGITFCLSKPPGKRELQETMEAALQGKRCHSFSMSVEKKEHHDQKSLPMPTLQVLLVEDNTANRELARVILENCFHKIIEATNGIEALELLCQHHFDAVILDIQMPVLDGLTTAEIIRQCEQNKETTANVSQELVRRLNKKISGRHIPIIAMTAHAMAGDREMCIKAGMDYYISKPFPQEELISILKQLVITPPASPKIITIPVSIMKTASSKPAATTDEVKAHLLTTCQMPQEKLDTLLKSFTKALAGFINDADLALAEEDAPALQLAAHSLKGGLMNLGLDRWADDAYKLECIAKNEKIIPAQHSALLKELSDGLAPLFVYS